MPLDKKLVCLAHIIGLYQVIVLPYFYFLFFKILFIFYFERECTHVWRAGGREGKSRGEGQSQRERLGVGSRGIPLPVTPWGKEQAWGGGWPCHHLGVKGSSGPLPPLSSAPLYSQLRAPQGRAGEPGFPKRDTPPLTQEAAEVPELGAPS